MMGAMVQFRKWDDILSGQLPKPEKPRLLAWYHWARAIAQAEKGNLTEAKAESHPDECGPQGHKKANKGKIRPEMMVAEAELKGHLNMAEKHVDKGLRQLAKAAERERRLDVHGTASVSETCCGGARLTGRCGTGKRRLRKERSKMPWRNIRLTIMPNRACAPYARSPSLPDCDVSAFEAAVRRDARLRLPLCVKDATVQIIERSHFPRHKVCGEFLSPGIEGV